MKPSTAIIARYALQLIEPLWLCAMVIAYWHHSPPIRDEWVGLMWGAVPIFALRYALWGRLATPQALLWAMLAIVPLSLLNYEYAPYARQSYIVLMVRPLLGIWLVIYSLEVVRQYNSLKPLLAVTITLTGIVAWLGLTASQWTTKSAPLNAILEMLPTISYRTHLPDMLLSFNVNEMGGALAWLIPLAIGIAILPRKSLQPALRYSALCVGVLALAALLLGQSRFAIVGVLGALWLMMLLLLQNKARWLGVIIMTALILFQMSLILDIPIPNATTPSDTAITQPNLLSTRDESTLNQRLEIWQRTSHMIADYPLTGVGMSMFYLAVRYEPYIVTQLQDRPPPHAHNAVLQIGADLGIPGILLWLMWHATASLYLWRIWRKGNPLHRHLALTLAFSLIAHTTFGLGDAIKLWDRYAFIGWWLWGFIGALYFHHIRHNTRPHTPMNLKSYET